MCIHHWCLPSSEPDHLCWVVTSTTTKIIINHHHLHRSLYFAGIAKTRRSTNMPHYSEKWSLNISNLEKQLRHGKNTPGSFGKIQIWRLFNKTWKVRDDHLRR
uniref:Uncharacterized protein n=1 Tax=Kalanchoe fedtschenkoi TaxID=63787 RepID=A0A7N0V960_KALFE